MRPANHLDLLSLERDIRARTKPKFEIGQSVRIKTGTVYTVQKRYWDGRNWRYAIRAPGKQVISSDGHVLQGFTQIRTVPQSALVALNHSLVSVAIHPLPLHNPTSPHYPLVW